MDWRHPPDDLARVLGAARDAVLSHTADPWHAVEPFEALIEELKYSPSAREEKLPRVRSFGRELFAELRSVDRPVAIEVRHYCWYLQHLGEPEGTSATDMLMFTLTRFAHFASHEVTRCRICAEFRDDLPFQGSPGGRAHFREWLRRRACDASP